jgi:hypothetical protein
MKASWVLGGTITTIITLHVIKAQEFKKRNGRRQAPKSELPGYHFARQDDSAKYKVVNNSFHTGFSHYDN